MRSSGETNAEAGTKFSREVKVRNKLGLHARPATEFVKTAMQYSADITVAKDGHVSDGKSVIGLLMLAAGPGTSILVTAKGSDAKAALEALVSLVGDKFGEE